MSNNPLRRDYDGGYEPMTSRAWLLAVGALGLLVGGGLVSSGYGAGWVPLILGAVFVVVGLVGIAVRD